MRYRPNTKPFLSVPRPVKTNNFFLSDLTVKMSCGCNARRRAPPIDWNAIMTSPPRSTEYFRPTPAANTAFSTPAAAPNVKKPAARTVNPPKPAGATPVQISLSCAACPACPACPVCPTAPVTEGFYLREGFRTVAHHLPSGYQ